MTIYDDLRVVATDLLTDFDQGGLVLRVATKGAGPAHNPGATTYADTSFPGVARGVSQRYVDGSLIIATDKQVTMPANFGTPVVEDLLTLDGTDHQILKVIQIPAAGTAVAFVLIVRK